MGRLCGSDHGIRVMVRFPAIAATIALLTFFNAATGTARQPQSRQAEQHIESAVSQSETRSLYSCRLNPNQSAKERRKKVSLICEPVVNQ
jgi:hypothetical protein